MNYNLIKTHIESLFLNHPHLKRDAYLAKDGDKLAYVIVDRQPQHYTVTDENYELIVKIFENAKGRSIRTALVNDVPSEESFIEAGGKRKMTRDPYYKVEFSGDTTDVYTVGGKWRGRVDPSDNRRIQWIQREGDES